MSVRTLAGLPQRLMDRPEIEEHQADLRRTWGLSAWIKMAELALKFGHLTPEGRAAWVEFKAQEESGS